LDASNGGLSAELWKGSPRPLVEKLLSAAALPAESPSLNRLARKLLLTTAIAPQGKSDQNLKDLRVEKLLALGQTQKAAALADLSKNKPLKSDVQLDLLSALMLQEDAKDACATVPSFMNEKSSPAWQKLMILCQLRYGDAKAAQLSLELLRDQMGRDSVSDIFLGLATKNLIGQSKILPRRLTPLQPVNLALLRQIGLPLPTETFAKSDAAFSQVLLQAKAADEGDKLAYADKLGERGLIGAKELAAVYKSFPKDATGKETAARQRARLYQDMSTQTSPVSILSAADRFVQTLDGATASGTATELLADVLKTIPADENLKKYATLATQVFVFAGKPEEATPWLKIARSSEENKARLLELWPVLAVSGLVTDTEFVEKSPTWFAAALKNEDPVKRQRLASTAALLNAAGFVLPDEAWDQMADTAFPAKRVAPTNPVWAERLQAKGYEGRKGEAILLAILLAPDPAGETPLHQTCAAIRALRAAGLSGEAMNLAREAIVAQVMP
jgi:hypothetical protein